MTGGVGNDTLNGGSGLDCARYLGNRADYQVSRVGFGQFAVTDNNPGNGNEGSDNLIGIERIQFADAALKLPSSVLSASHLGRRPVTNDFLRDWTVLDSRTDFTGDGRADVLLRKADGSPALWLQDGTGPVGSRLAGTPSGWTLVESHGDYNGDGIMDLLYRSADGTMSIWTLQGGLQAGQTGRLWASPDMVVVDARSDANGDGRSDILLQGPGGAVSTLASHIWF